MLCHPNGYNKWHFYDSALSAGHWLYALWERGYVIIPRKYTRIHHTVRTQSWILIIWLWATETEKWVLKNFYDISRRCLALCCGYPHIHNKGAVKSTPFCEDRQTNYVCIGGLCGASVWDTFLCVSCDRNKYRWPLVWMQIANCLYDYGCSSYHTPRIVYR